MSRSTNWAAFTPKFFSVVQSGYGWKELYPDFLAGLTVAIVALPLSMALAIASGASPDKGLVTAVIAGFFISLLGGSKVQIGGPTGAFVVVVFDIISRHGYDGLVLATLMAGVILIIAGYAKLGQIIRFIPHPVITGFTAGIAVIIASSQVKDFFGLQLAETPADFIPKWEAYFHAFPTLNVTTFAIACASLVMMVTLRRVAPRFPAYIVIIAFFAVLVALFQLPVETIGSRYHEIPSGLPVPHLPTLDFLKLKEVLPSAFIIAFLAGIEALLSAVVADGMTGFRHRPNQELIGQGVANLASAAFGGLPATGAIARTATNIKAGGKTPVAGVFHAIFVLLFIQFGSHLITYIPMAVLAAILFIVAWGMSEIDRFIHLLKMPMSDRTVLLLTFGLTVLVDLTTAIGIGVTLSSILFMTRMSRAVEMGMVDSPLDEANGEERDQQVVLPKCVEVFRIAGPVFFGVGNELIDTLKNIGRTPRILIIRMRLVPILDASGAAAMDEFVKQCSHMGTSVIFSAVQRQPAKILEKAGLGPTHPNIRYAENYAQAIEIAKDICGLGHAEVRPHLLHDL